MSGGYDTTGTCAHGISLNAPCYQCGRNIPLVTSWPEPIYFHMALDNVTKKGEERLRQIIREELEAKLANAFERFTAGFLDMMKNLEEREREARGLEKAGKAE